MMAGEKSEMTWNEIYFFSYRHWILLRCSQILSSRDDDSTANNGSMKTSHNFFITFPPHSLSFPIRNFCCCSMNFSACTFSSSPSCSSLVPPHGVFRPKSERDYCGATGKFIHFFPPSTHPLPDAFRWQQQLQQQVRVFPSSSIFCTPLETMAMFQMRKTARTSSSNEMDMNFFFFVSCMSTEFCGWNVFHYHVFQPHARATSDLISMTLWYFPSSICYAGSSSWCCWFRQQCRHRVSKQRMLLPQPHSTTREHNNSLLFFTFFYRFTPVELLTRHQQTRQKAKRMKWEKLNFLFQCFLIIIRCNQITSDTRTMEKLELLLLVVVMRSENERENMMEWWWFSFSLCACLESLKTPALSFTLECTQNWAYFLLEWAVWAEKEKALSEDKRWQRRYQWGCHQQEKQTLTWLAYALLSMLIFGVCCNFLRAFMLLQFLLHLFIARCSGTSLGRRELSCLFSTLMSVIWMMLCLAIVKLNELFHSRV